MTLKRVFSRRPCQRIICAVPHFHCQSLQTVPFSAQAAKLAEFPSSKPVDCPGFKRSLGEKWIYPLNEPLRDYQRAIVKRALFENTLVALPTGLGKTLIAAVVMYNYYRWYPEGKVLFVAPTRPLVEQQVAACFRSMGFPSEEAARMTGDLKPTDRARFWMKKRVFFLTPQTLQKDLESGRLPAGSVRCLVVDEAHKAMGKHAYCESVRLLLESNKRFRLLALSATPGNDHEAIQQVLSNLKIEHVESRTEYSPDVAPYLPGRSVDHITVPLSEELRRLKALFKAGLQPKLDELHKAGIIKKAAFSQNSFFKLYSQSVKFYASTSQYNPGRGTQIASYYLGFVISYFRAYELLLKYGQRTLFYYMLDRRNDLTSSKKAQWTTLNRTPPLLEVWDCLRRRYGAAATEARIASHADKLSNEAEIEFCKQSHPKMHQLATTLLEHFSDTADGSDGAEGGTRAMVFSGYRSSVVEICDFLSLFPSLRPSVFIGHADTRSGGSGAAAGDRGKGKSEREQADTIADFLDGTSNVLVSTCVGEEGLDVGEVDLIVSFDAVGSALRNVQRMGRTGRRRPGRVVELLTQGAEQGTHYMANHQQRNVLSRLLEDLTDFKLFEQGNRLVPDDLQPVESLQTMTIPRYTDLTLKDQDVAQLEERKPVEKLQAPSPPKKVALPPAAAAVPAAPKLKPVSIEAKQKVKVEISPAKPSPAVAQVQPKTPQIEELSKSEAKKQERKAALALEREVERKAKKELAQERKIAQALEKEAERKAKAEMEKERKAANALEKEAERRAKLEMQLERKAVHALAALQKVTSRSPIADVNSTKFKADLSAMQGQVAAIKAEQAAQRVLLEKMHKLLSNPPHKR